MDSLTTLDPGFEQVFAGPFTASFRLLDLPVELVLRIIELAVQKPKPIDPTRATKFKYQKQIVQQPAICRVSKLFRRQVHLYYKLNTFELYHKGGVSTSHY
jgi:hypothetical protein